MSKNQKTKQPPHLERLEKAKSALRKGAFVEASILARKIIPTATDALSRQTATLILVESLFRAVAVSTDPVDSLNHLDEAIKLSPNQARLHYHRALIFYRLGRWKDAEAALSRTLQLDPKRSGVNFLIQLARIMNKEAYATTGLTSDEQNQLRLALQLQEGGNLKEVAKWVSQTPIPHAVAWKGLLEMLADAKAAPSESFQAVDQSPIFQYYAGLSTLRKGEKETALITWRAIAPEVFRPSWLVQNLAGVTREYVMGLVRAGEWENASDYLSDLQIIQEDTPLSQAASVVFTQLGIVAAENNRWDKAAEHWREAQRFGGSRQLAQNVALAEERAGNYNAAAEAWREMIKRRPRKEDHPDYLSDEQVAAIWKHIAGCYLQENEFGQAITCVKNAIKYAETDIEARLALTDLYHHTQSIDAAENELQRILQLDPNHIQALLRLGSIYTDRYDRDPMPIWKQILTIDPQQEDARTALAELYVEMTEDDDESGNPFAFLFGGGRAKRKAKGVRATLEEGLKFVPNHPLLLQKLGIQLHKEKKYAESQKYLRQAWDAAPTDVENVSRVIHELLHAKGEAIVEELLPSVRNLSGLMVEFWLHQAVMVIQCKLEDKWAKHFWQEAITLSELGRGQNTKAHTLTFICITTIELKRMELQPPYLEQLRKEFPNHGGVEFVEARQVAQQIMEESEAKAQKGRAIRTPDFSKVRTLLKEAKRKALNANEKAMAEQIEELENGIARLTNPMQGLFGGGGKRRGGPIPEDVMEFMNNLDEETLRELRKHF